MGAAVLERQPLPQTKTQNTPNPNSQNLMDGITSSSGGGGGGTAPFLLKTYDMVDDSSTDGIVSWSSSRTSFVVWNPPEFARVLLPTYFKHNNFSSFIRQLNTYGFRKIDPERWEFANEDFVKDQKHLLKNIHRRKPIHSHSHPQGSLMDPERAAFDEEIERLSRKKAALEANVLRLKQQRSAAKVHLEDLTQRVGNMEQRQESLLASLEKAVQNPTFVEQLIKKIESMDFSAYNKKRRLPRVDDSQVVAENSFLDNNSSSRTEFGNIFQHDFSNKLRLELSPAVSDINLVSRSTQSSNEDGDSSQRKISEGDPKETQMRIEGLLCAPDTLELSDTGASFTFKMDSSLLKKAPSIESPSLHSLPQSLTSNEDGDGPISCLLNLTLASSPLQVGHSSARMPLLDQVGKPPESRLNSNSQESDFRVLPKNINLVDENTALSSSQDAPNNNQGPAVAQVRVNDVFWEQFLTERPGSSDNEEASSNYRGNLNEEQEDRKSGNAMSRNSRNVEQLTL